MAKNQGVAVLCITMAAVIASGQVFAREPKPRPTYGEVQRAWGVLVGHTGTLMVWFEECKAREPGAASDLEQAFTTWKERNGYMDMLKDRLYKRAIQEGGTTEAKRLSEEITATAARSLESVRKDIRTGKEWGCPRLLTILKQPAFDPSERYTSEIDVLLRAVE